MRWLALYILIFASSAWGAWQNVAQEWEPYFEKVTPDERDRMKSWFKSVRSPHGVPCCDWADGHRTREDHRSNHYWIPNPLDGTEGAADWIEVPQEAVVYGAGNPFGEPIVWYVIQGPGAVYIRCFVPGGGV